MTELVDAKNLLWNIRRDISLTMRFPTTGEPKGKYYLENRANRLAYINRRYENGWLPDAPVGWWIPLMKPSEELVEPLVFYVRDINTGKNVLCTLTDEGQIIRKQPQ